jgi:hypothetical protein
MYTGTLIEDLMAAVERVELFSELRHLQKSRVDEMELRRMFGLQGSQQRETETVFAGAA